MTLIKENYHYTATHEWIRKEKEGHFTVGITDHAQSLLGDVVFVELPLLQKKIAMKAEVAVIESVKAAADVYAPLSGEIIAINENLISQPELINQSPYETGWLFQIRAKDNQEIQELLNAAQYKALMS